MICQRRLVTQLPNEWLTQNNTTNRCGTNYTWKCWCLHSNLRGKNSVEIKLTEEFSRKHPVLPVSLIKPYFQTEEDKLPRRKKNANPPEIGRVEQSPIPVTKVLKARKIILNCKDQRQYLVSVTDGGTVTYNTRKRSRKFNLDLVAFSAQL
ncbi:hypothetical protein O181_101375 [Austropuccinia psidii MF-1]|uniref:Uncharacterized protein n=1 Tax=Austropuccinia psidii MF-1 TaxID=1389203 RepID=A0A9Q3JEB8_9BASI|nr:hypothetical protein [Austropuccinia psidii MF-1]